jgi:hypothetical protein
MGGTACTQQRIGKSGRPFTCASKHQAVPAFANTFPLCATYHMTTRILFSMLLFTVISLSCQFGIREPHSLEYNKETFDQLAKEILSQDEVFEMDDFSRYSKRLNNVSVRLSRESSGEEYGSFVDSVVDSLGIDRTLVEKLRQKLEKTQLREFYKRNDSVLFVVDGFLDDSWGFLYSRNQLKSDTNYVQFGEFDVRYIDSVNQYWRKVSVN